jgi:mannose-6-phosphate isomerase-like protein (cupin superfamily)
MRRLERFSAYACIAALLALVQAPAGRATEKPPAVTFLAAADVEAAFAKGMPLVERDGYKVHASRRESDGQAEVHTKDTDILYVLEGTSTVVTGGEVVDPRTTAPEEIRGASIRGGASRKLAKGDVLIVPNGTPHWFREVTAPFLYYVVKVRAAEGDRS